MTTTTPVPAARLIDTIADGLVQARRYQQPWVPAGFDPALTLDDAYAVQAAVGAAMGWFPSGRATAWKAGGKVQMTAAPLPLVLPSGASWQPEGGEGLVMEAEIAFRLGLAPTSAQGILDCIATLCVTIEMVSTRLAGGLQAPLPWKLADQQVHAVLVAGDEVPFVARDWSQQACRVTINGHLAGAVTGTHPNGDALAPLPWLFEHVRRRGLDLRAGDLVTTGAWFILPVQPGDHIEAEFAGIGRTVVDLGA